MNPIPHRPSPHRPALSALRFCCPPLSDPVIGVASTPRSGCHRPGLARIGLITLGALSLATAAQAQEFLRPEFGGRTYFTDPNLARRAAEPAPNEPGPVQISLSASLSGSYVDNVALNDSNPEHDFIIAPGVAANVVWPFSRNNLLNFGIGVNYALYTRNSEYNRFNITPNSSLMYNLKAGNFFINLHDYFSYSVNPLDYGSVNDTAEFGGFNNTAGLAVTWPQSRWSLVAGYDHFNFVSTVSGSDAQDRGSELFFLRAPIQLSPVLTLGPDASVSLSYYDQPLHNDSVNYSFGVSGSWMATRVITVTPRFGYTIYTFDNNGVFPSEDSSGFYADLLINHTINQYLNHSLNGGRSFQLGINSDLTDNYYAGYRLNLNLVRKLPMNVSFRYEHGEDSSSLYGENYDRFGGGVGISWEVMQKGSLGLNYQVYTKNSNQANRDYVQNSVTLNFGYRF